MNSFITTIFPAVMALSGAILGTMLTHLLYIRRWKLERIEGYKTEIFKAKLQVYRKLVGLYLEFTFKIDKHLFDGSLTDAVFRAAINEVDSCIKQNAFLISVPVRSIATHDIVDELSQEKDFYKRVDYMRVQNEALAQACREELGVDAISDDIKKMFPIPIKPEVEIAQKEANDKAS